jgi:hypothetical protein
MRLIIVLALILVLALFSGCTDCSKPLSENISAWAKFERCGENIPQKYEDIKYCEEDSDCVILYTGEQSISLNKYNYVDNFREKVYEATGRYPHRYAQDIPTELRISYCEKNQCGLRTDCSKCNEINEFVEAIGCLKNDSSVTVQGACYELEKCDC